MKVINCVKIGSLVDPDPEKRGVVEVLDQPIKELGPHDLLIKVAYCGICGSDPHMIEGIFQRPTPMGIGHEISGVIVDKGSEANINGFEIGDRVAGNFRNVCGTCYYCTNGMEQFCESSGVPQPGMAEYLVWHEKQAVKLPDDVSLKIGSLLEPVSIAVRAIDKAQIQFGQNVLISGGGPIGLLTLQAASMYGAANLTLLEPNPQRRELGLKYGAKYVFDPTKDDVQAEMEKITNGRGYDVLFEVSGVGGAANSMAGLASKMARIVYVAQYSRDFNLQVDAYDKFYHKEMDMTGILVSPYTFTRTAQIISRFDLEAFTNKVFYIDDAKEAFDTHMTGEYPKVLIKCNSDLE